MFAWHWLNHCSKSYEPTDKRAYNGIIPGNVSGVSLHEDPSKEIEKKKTKGCWIYYRRNHCVCHFIVRHNSLYFFNIIFLNYQNFYTRWRGSTRRRHHNILNDFDGRTLLFLVYFEFPHVHYLGYFVKTFANLLDVSPGRLFLVVIRMLAGEHATNALISRCLLGNTSFYRA